MSQTVELLQRLRQFILIEAENQHEALLKQWSKPLSERVANGWAIEGLSVITFKNDVLTLACQTNQSRFREGDRLVLHRGNPQDKEEILHIELELDEETQLEAWIADGIPIILDRYPDGWIADQDQLDLSYLYLDALDRVADSARGRSTILPLLQGSLSPIVDFARYERALEAIRDQGINDSQMEAVAQAYATNLAYLIKGPPGTGKTFMLAQLVKLLVQEGQRVLVTALTHRAIHNALNKIASVDRDILVCKIGDPRRSEDLDVPCYQDFNSSHFGDMPGGYAIGATPFTALGKRLANVEFDTVIFDESSQITLPLAIMAMLSGDKYIFIGDENQLPPVTTTEAPLIGKESIFGYLSGRGYDCMLTTTYRMNDVLTDWPSRHFYQNELRPTPEVGQRRLLLDPGPTVWDFALDPTAPAVFLDLGHVNTTVRSRTEADVVSALVTSLMEHGIPAYEIGVLVPYRAQSRLIRSLLRRSLPDRETLRSLVVDTVERMQGQEREVILVSLTTSNPTYAAWVAEFFFQPQRLNVAVTRPRTKLILVGSRSILKTQSADPAVTDSIELLRDLIDRCTIFTIPQGNLR